MTNSTLARGHESVEVNTEPVELSGDQWMMIRQILRNRGDLDEILAEGVLVAVSRSAWKNRP